MKSNKISTLFLLLLMLFTLTMSVGCGKENDTTPNDKEDDSSEVVDNKDNQNDQDNTTEKDNSNKEEQKTVKLLKRNGVEWKENTSINSYVGAEKYTVVWGDTLSLVARTWNVNCYTLARYNGIENIDLIEVGQVIYNYTYKG